MRVISYGGGVQSTAMLVLTATGRIDPVDAVLFANVGDDSEHPATLAYVRDHAMPYARAHGINLVELYRVGDDHKPRTLHNLLMTENTPSIPVRLEGGAPANRTCTRRFKVDVIARWLRDQGVKKSNPATVLLGISTDEIQRANTRQSHPLQLREYPLIDLGLNRSMCASVIESAGLPVPPKSSCFFCPFKRPQQWAEMRRDEPELFERAAQIEDRILAKRQERGKDAVYLTRLGGPLREVINEQQDTLPFDGPDIDECDEGVCFV